MRYKKLMESLFSTKNINKILNEFNKISSKEKQVILSDNKIKQRIYKIADITLLVNLLIDLPCDFRVSFLKDLNKDKFTKDYELTLLDFLTYEDYTQFETKRIYSLANNKNNQLISLIFRKLSNEKLKEIIDLNIEQSITDTAFVEYSKKNPELKIYANIANKISQETLISELKRRNNNKVNQTIFDISEFIKIESSKQNSIIQQFNYYMTELEYAEECKKHYKALTSEEINEEFNELLKEFIYLDLFKLRNLITVIDNDLCKELIKIFIKTIYEIDIEIEDKYINNIIYLLRNDKLSTKELYEITKLKPYSLINYLNTGTIDHSIDALFTGQSNYNYNIYNYRFTATLDQYQKVNSKKINKIINLVNSLYKSYIENPNPKPTKVTDPIILSYKLYFIFGYDISIELLNNKFGNISYSMLDDLLKFCKTNNVEFQKISNGNYEPTLNHSLIQFLIGDKKDNNTTIRRIIRNELPLLVSNFSKFYNNFERYQKKIGKKIHLNKLMSLLETNPLFLLPNEYKLTKDIIDNILKSQELNLNQEEYLDKIEEQKATAISKAQAFYHNYLDKRITSSIPRVSEKTKDNYYYEVLKLDDPNILTVGYLTKCCFRLNGMSEEFLQYCCENPHGRVIVIRNKSKEICAMIPIVRNGNVVAGNSIESNGDNKQVYYTLKEAFDKIIKVSKESEPNPIIACTVTDQHDNVSPYTKDKLKYSIFPIREEKFYTNYESATYIVSIDKDKTESDIKLYTPESIYLDERPEVYIYKDGEETPNFEEIKNRINSINFQLDLPEKDYYYEKYVICSEDWYLIVDYSRIHGQCLPKDPRAIEEYNKVKSYLEEKFKREDNDFYWNTPIIEKSDIKPSISKKRILLKKDPNML